MPVTAPNPHATATGFGPLRHVSRREVLYLPGDEPESVYFLAGGDIRLSQIQPDGRMLDILAGPPGRIFGELEVLLDIPRKTQAIAGPVGALVRSMTRAAFLAQLAGTSAIQNRIIHDLAAKALESDRLAGEMACQRAGIRLEMFLTRQYAGGRRRLRTTHTELAQLVGVNRETVTRILGDLVERGAVMVEPRYVTVVRPDLLVHGT